MREEGNGIDGGLSVAGLTGRLNARDLLHRPNRPWNRNLSDNCSRELVTPLAPRGDTTGLSGDRDDKHANKHIAGQKQMH